MYSRINSYVLKGLTARPVRVTLHIDSEGEGFRIAGLEETMTRTIAANLRAAIASAGFEFPRGAITVCFSAPAEASPALEQLQLAIAVAILSASSQVSPESLERVAFAGSLCRDGTLGFAFGAVQMAEAAAADPRIEAFALASPSAPVAASAGGVEVLKLYSLAAIRYLAASERSRIRLRRPAQPAASVSPPSAPATFAEPPSLTRAVEVAVAGDHSLLLGGPKGRAAHRALARRIPAILPALTHSEWLEVLRIAGSCEEVYDPVCHGRPFRAPKAAPDAVDLFGDNEAPAAGEAIRAHLGVLYLSAPERIDPALLERIWIAHGASAAMLGDPALWMPSAFFLVASAAPCSCARPDSDLCACAPGDRDEHRRRQRAATQRFEVLAESPSLSSEAPSERDNSPAAVRSRITAARARQVDRLGEGRVNRQMSAAEVEDCGLTQVAADSLNGRFPYPDQAGLRLRVARVARTLADLDAAEGVEAPHVFDAIRLTTPLR